MTDGSFTPRARAEILGRSLNRCAGCSRTEPLTCQHRRGRGMGGTSSARIAESANGVALCGSGTTGCHGWTEAHPAEARLLGWRLDHPVIAARPDLAPYLEVNYGGPAWWAVDADGLAVFVAPLEECPPERLRAVIAYLDHLRETR